MCIGKVSRKHRAQERETKWFPIERTLGIFQEGEGVERGKG
jgi:hypothetical protein